MQITRRCVHGIQILDLAGRLVAWTDPGRASLRATVLGLASEGPTNVLVDVSELTDIDAHGLGELAWSCATLRSSGGQMALIAPRLEARRLLALTRLDTVLPIYESENEALTSARVEVLI